LSRGQRSKEQAHQANKKYDVTIKKYSQVEQTLKLMQQQMANMMK